MGGGQKDLHIKGQVRHNGGGGGVDLKMQGSNPFQSNLGATRDT